MSTIEKKFKTNINCGGCIEKVTPYLKEVENIQWEVDTTAKEKILTIVATHDKIEKAVQKVSEAGFNIETI